MQQLDNAGLQVRDPHDITNPTRHSPPWKSNSPSASQATPCISWYPIVHRKIFPIALWPWGRLSL